MTAETIAVGDSGSTVSPLLLEVIHRLPQPMHLFAALTGSDHFHFGWFRYPSDSLQRAQQRMADEIAARLPERAAVLDVGSALGGTAAAIARRGHPTLGIDPCRGSNDFARRFHRSDASLRFTTTTLQQFHRRSHGHRFGAVTLVEVLQHLGRLPEVLAACRDLVAPGGQLLVADIVTSRPFPWRAVPFHQRGSIERNAEVLGFELLDKEDVTVSTRPTMSVLESALRGERDRLAAVFGDTRGDVHSEIEELATQCRHLRGGLEHGDLYYEILRLRRR